MRVRIVRFPETRVAVVEHYVNVGPDVREEDMITDVYLPLQEADGR